MLSLYVGPLTNLVLWLGGFWLEIGLWFLLSVFIYSWLYQYHITRWLIAYPSVLIISNVMAWIFFGCLWFMGSIFGLFYEAFFTESGISNTSGYVDFAGNMFTISTIFVTFLALRFIYNQEKSYWDSKKSESK